MDKNEEIVQVLYWKWQARTESSRGAIAFYKRTRKIVRAPSIFTHVGTACIERGSIRGQSQSASATKIAQRIRWRISSCGRLNETRIGTNKCLHNIQIALIRSFLFVSFWFSLCARAPSNNNNISFALCRSTCAPASCVARFVSAYISRSRFRIFTLVPSRCLPEFHLLGVDNNGECAPRHTQSHRDGPK